MASYNVAEPLLPFLIPIDQIRPHPRNPRRGALAAIAQSLDTYGQLKNIVVQADTGYIAAGNQTYHAALNLGWSHVAAARVPLTDDETLAFMVADNRTHDLGGYEQDALNALLRDLRAAERLTGTGYQAADVDALLADLAAPSPTSFLNTFLGDEPDAPRAGGGAVSYGGSADEGAGEAAGVVRTVTVNGDDYVQLAYVVPAADKLAIVEAINHARSEWQLDTTGAALLAIANDYLARHR